MNFTKPTSQVARESHHCTFCYRRIDKGETYWRGRGYDYGDAWTWRSCAHCWAITRIYDPSNDEGLYSENGFECWIDNGARDMTELRHMVGYRMRCRAKGGTLLPVPQPVVTWDECGGVGSY